LKLDKIKSLTQLKTAVLFLVFNRPDTTKEVFEKISLAKPSRLYVAGDGPRNEFKDDKKKVTNARKFATKVDWPCEVKRLCKEFGFTAGMLKGSLAKVRGEI